LPRRIAIIQGHPDPAGGHLGHALAAAYARGAAAGGHEVRTIEVARLDFPVLRTKRDGDEAAPPAAIRACQETIRWAEHLVILYPLWLGGMPALLKAFLEQTLRPGFAVDRAGGPAAFGTSLAGRSARIVVTMGMPAFVYRCWFGAHGVKSLKRSILGFCGMRPIREMLLGMVEGEDDSRRRRWLARLEALGRAGV
jgi:putative NADPH-quinone reductase